MGSNIELQKINMSVRVEEFEEERDIEKVNFVVEDLDNIKVELSDSDVNDITELFDKIFEFIILEKKLIEFSLEDGKSNLFFEVANDIIDHLNNEIKESEDNFKKIIRLNEKK